MGTNTLFTSGYAQTSQLDAGLAHGSSDAI